MAFMEMKKNHDVVVKSLMNFYEAISLRRKGEIVFLKEKLRSEEDDMKMIEEMRKECDRVIDELKKAHQEEIDELKETLENERKSQKRALHHYMRASREAFSLLRKGEF